LPPPALITCPNRPPDAVERRHITILNVIGPQQQQELKMQEARLIRAAKALGDMPLTAKHEIGELDPFTLRTYLEEMLVDEVSSDVDIDQVLRQMVEIALTTYNSDE
jgi:hypothetical protein